MFSTSMGEKPPPAQPKETPTCHKFLVRLHETGIWQLIPRKRHGLHSQEPTVSKSTQNSVWKPPRTAALYNTWVDMNTSHLDLSEGVGGCQRESTD